MMRIHRVYTAVGLLLLAAALFLTGYNIWSEVSAGRRSASVLDELASAIEEAGSDMMQEEDYIPDYLLNPEMEMPVSEIDGRDYIGVLDIPALSLSLPILSEWSYKGLKIAPCRYSGSAYLDNMVLAGHNYSRHFGNLKTLSPGDKVTFTDAAGNVFDYEVMDLEILSPYAVAQMTEGDWDLTLFTCTVGGRSRVTVRCVRTA